MNKFLLCAILFIYSSAAFSQSSCPTRFLRTNGNNGGCGAHLLLYYATCPTVMPILDSVEIDGVIAPQTFTLIGKTCNGTNSFIDYCVSGNLPPISRITVFMTYPGGTGGSGCNVTTGVMPIVLSGFQLQRKSSDVFVSWQTQQEINSSNFDIERSYDDVTFEKIGSVVAAGSSNNARSYSFIDNSNASKKASFYRVKMIDKDGAFTYTEIKSIGGSEAATDFIIFPNPCHGNAKITISNLAEPTDIQVMDVTGRMVKRTSLTNTNVAEINNLQNGTYFVRIIGQGSGQTSVRKLSVIN
jgi:Secretion system C-terminal sorting domain